MWFEVEVSIVREETRTIFVEAESAKDLEGGFMENELIIACSDIPARDMRVNATHGANPVEGVPDPSYPDRSFVCVKNSIPSLVPAVCAEAVRRVIESSDTLCLDNESDRERLIAALLGVVC